jgi:hypothetical protein
MTKSFVAVKMGRATVESIAQRLDAG